VFQLLIVIIFEVQICSAACDLGVVHVGLNLLLNVLSFAERIIIHAKGITHSGMHDILALFQQRPSFGLQLF
jgi:hypothetical protein